MNDFLLYMIQVSVSMALFYGIYWLFLRKETFFIANRIYLLFSLVISIVIPFFDYSFFARSFAESYLVILDPITVTANDINNGIQYHLTTFQILLIVYITGLGIFSFRFLFQIFQLLRIMYNGKKEVCDGVSFIIADKKISPFSFFNYVFLSSDKAGTKEESGIIEHEKVHIQQKHTIDIILLELLTIIFWFNPFVWLYKKSIKTIHEYLADQGVLIKGYQKNTYQDLLLHQTFGIQINDLTNNFNHSLIKRRFIMMTKSRSGILARFKILLILPTAFLVLLITVSGKNVLAQDDKTTEKLVTSTDKINDKDLPPPPPPKDAQDKDPQKKDQVYTVVEVMPEYPGGRDALIKFVAENVKYPEKAIQEGVTGTVFIQFIVEKDGTISDIKLLKAKLNPKDASQEIQDLMVKSATKVIHEMPTWKPGKQDVKPVRVQYVLPVKYNLDEKEKEK